MRQCALRHICTMLSISELCCRACHCRSSSWFWPFHRIKTDLLLNYYPLRLSVINILYRLDWLTRTRLSQPNSAISCFLKIWYQLRSNKARNATLILQLRLIIYILSYIYSLLSSAPTTFLHFSKTDSILSVSYLYFYHLLPERVNWYKGCYCYYCDLGDHDIWWDGSFIKLSNFLYINTSIVIAPFYCWYHKQWQNSPCLQSTF